MQKLNYDRDPIVLDQKDEVISFKCELQENLQKAMKDFVEDHQPGINTGFTSGHRRIFDARISKSGFN